MATYTKSILHVLQVDVNVTSELGIRIIYTNNQCKKYVQEDGVKYSTLL